MAVRWKLKHLSDDELAELLRYKVEIEFKTVTMIMDDLDVSRTMVLNWLKKFSVPLPMVRKIFRHLTDPQLKDLLNQKIWVENKSIEALEREYSVSTPALFDWCKRLGVPTRSGSEANLIRFANSTKEENLAITAKAHAAVRGSKRSKADLEKRALSVEHQPMSKWELWFAKWLLEANITGFRHNYALNIFNLDFAFPENKIAIEIDGGGWHSSERKQLQDAKKEAFLFEQGWTLYRVTSNGWKSKRVITEYPQSYKRRSLELIQVLKATLNSNLDQGPF